MSTTHRGAPRRTLFAATAALLLVPFAAAAARPQEAGQDEPIMKDFGAPPQDDIQERMIKLFGEVEQHLREVDSMLYEASGVDRFEASDGVAKWVQNASDNSREAVEKIDELLRLSEELGRQQQQQQQQQQQSSGSGQNSGRQQQSSSSRQNQGRSSRERLDGDPNQASAEQQGRDQGEQQGPDQGGDQEQGSQSQESGDSQDGRHPDGDQGSDDEGQQRVGPGERREDGQRSGADARFGAWGELPPRTQEIFTNRASDDMPPQYREWIDSYYKRVSKRP
ncbi:MAG: hypothetical protein R3F34_17220 [Planctomycetota bacterium]